MADLRVSMLFEANTGAAKAGVAELKEATEALAQEMRETAGAADTAASGTAEWGSIVQMMRGQLMPMVGEVDALREGMQYLAVTEEMGAVNAREATIAHDLLSRQMTELVGRMEAAGVTMDGTTASVIRQDTALQQLINGTTGVSRATDQSIADTLRHGQALDALRARFDPVFAAQRQYEILLLDIADAERQGALTAQVAAEARTRASQAMATASGQVTQLGVSSGAAASYVANLGYQLNDIGMMMSLGQSPFMLMMQQGPQVVQVFGQMRAAGMQIGPAIAGAFTSMLNPLSIATMAVIGFGAAALQWFTGAGEEAQSLGEAIDELSSRVRSYRAAVDAALTPMGELRKEWGLQAGQIREVNQAIALLERVRAIRSLTEGVAKIREDLSGLAGDLRDIANIQLSIDSARQAEALGNAGPEQALMALQNQEGIVQKLKDQYGLTVDQATLLNEAVERLGQSQGPEAQRAALTAMRQVLVQILSETQDLPKGFVETAQQIINSEMAAWELARALEDGNGSARSLASVNMADGISAAGAQARILAAQLGISLDIARQLANIGGGALPPTTKPRIGFGAGIGAAEDPIIGGVPELRFGSNPGTGSNGTRDRRHFVDLSPPRTRGARGGGGGGATEVSELADAIEKQQQALDDLIESEQRQIAMMLETDPVQREIMRNHEALKGATEAERAEVEKLIAERVRLEEVKSRIDEIGAAGKSAFVGLVTGAHSFSDALSMVISKLAEMAASAAWDSLWGGIGGGILGGLFGGGGMTGDTGIFGLGMPMADGGRVYGPGGPRDDKVPAWLSNGEYVVNAAATAQHLPLIEAMNSGASMSDLVALIGGARPAWPAFADGGLHGSLNGLSAPSGWGLSGSRPGSGMTGGGAAMKVSVDVRAFFDDKEGRMMAEVQRVAQEVSQATTEEGITAFSAHMLPGRIAEIDANPRTVG